MVAKLNDNVTVNGQPGGQALANCPACEWNSVRGGSAPAQTAIDDAVRHLGSEGHKARMAELAPP